MPSETMDLDAPKSIKVPAWAYENARVAARELARRGTRSTSEKIGDERKCPICAGKLTPQAGGALQVRRCHSCGLSLPDLESAAGITAGMVIGLALALLVGNLID